MWQGEGVPTSVFVEGPLCFNDVCLYCLSVSERE